MTFFLSIFVKWSRRLRLLWIMELLIESLRLAVLALIVTEFRFASRVCWVFSIVLGSLIVRDLFLLGGEMVLRV